MVFLLVALESFLLKDEREAIQQNIVREVGLCSRAVC